jgi:hypothetical protein
MSDFDVQKFQTIKTFLIPSAKFYFILKYFYLFCANFFKKSFNKFLY